LVPIAYLDRPVPLLEDGKGPLVVGVAQDALLGKAIFMQLQERNSEREK
jgi:hypothetical protein